MYLCSHLSFCYLFCSLFSFSSFHPWPPSIPFLLLPEARPLHFIDRLSQQIIKFTDLTNKPDTPVCSKVKALHSKPLCCCQQKAFKSSLCRLHYIPLFFRTVHLEEENMWNYILILICTILVLSKENYTYFHPVLMKTEADLQSLGGFLQQVGVTIRAECCGIA